MNMDIKIVNLYKLHIPKTESLRVLIGNDENDPKSKHRYYLTMGHYDLIDIENPTQDGTNELRGENCKDTEPLLKHLLSRVYRYEQRSRLCPHFISKRDFSSQNMPVFTNIISDDEPADKKYYGFTQKQIKEFWDGSNDHEQILFVSMLHVNDFLKNINNDQACSVNIAPVLDAIKRCFHKKFSYLYYFSFDYSDIMIFCKTQKVSKYVKTIYNLNYGLDSKYIRDSFSLYGLCRSYLLKKMDSLKKIYANDKENADEIVKNNFLRKGKNCSDPINADEEFFLKINIGVQNSAILEIFRNKIEYFKSAIGFTDIIQIGRNDYSIVTERATKEWLIFLEYLIDESTTVCKGFRSESSVFSTFEAFIGATCDKFDILPNNKRLFIENLRYENEKTEEIYSELKKQLSHACDVFKKNIFDLFPQNAANYYIPIMEVENSIDSIVKNRFADDFVVCMYESFYSFLVYMTNKICIHKNELNGNYLTNEEFDNTFNDYFKGLIALVNSGMHTDRSFIQATAFNAILYDIPPKLMSFYTAVVYRIMNIMRDDDKYNYSFMFTPNFSSEIRVGMISYRNIIPEDRLLFISINETFFYNPSMVISTLAHEIAHVAGDKKRSRDIRFSGFLKCIIAAIFDNCLIDANCFGMTPRLSRLIRSVHDVILPYFKASDKEILDMLFYIELAPKIVDMTLEFMKNSVDISIYVYNFIKEVGNDAEVECGFPVDNKPMYIFDRYRTRLASIDLTETDGALSVIPDITRVYKEAYSDMQMIMLLSLSFESYMDKLAVYENEFMLLSKSVHRNRLTVLTKLMLTIGAWSLNDMLSYKKENIVNMILDDVRKLNAFCAGTSVEKKEESVACSYIMYRKKLDADYDVKTEGFAETAAPDWECYYCVQEYLYLLEAAEATLKHYNAPDMSEKLHEIVKLINIYECIDKFEDITAVYTTIREEMETYKESLQRLHEKYKFNIF